ncbi:MAG: MliC family protein [Alphaproteobacteria bacterium]|nr:MliC family protein [Alphaproteobacteria bacterium]
MKRLFIIFALMTLVACDKTPDNVIHCGDYNVEMAFSDDGEHLNAVINGDPVALDLAVSASGAKYTGILNDIEISLWGKGDNWTLILEPDETFSCTD